MRPMHLTTLVGAALSLCTSAALADPALGARTFALGIRGGAQLADYRFGTVGGQLRVRPADRVALDLFTDHHFGDERGGARHDHEIGATLQYDVVRGSRWALHPLVGACGTLAVSHAPQGGLTATDVRFGLRGGVGFEALLGERLSLQLQAQAIAYIGHAFAPYAWPGGTEDRVSVQAAAQVHAAINFWL